MAAKYIGLPDIDTAPDIFETIDEPETPLKPSDNSNASGDVDASVRPISEAIDANHLPSRRKAERVFGRGTRRPDSSSISFRPRLPPLSHYASSSSDSDELSHPPRETPAARLRRLKKELEEVEAEIRSSSSSQTTNAQNDEVVPGKRKSVLPPRQPIDVVSELANVREELERLSTGDLPEVGMNRSGGGEWGNRLNRLVVAEQRKGVEQPQSVAGAHGGGWKDTSLSDIDKRLTLLESVLGVMNNVDQTSPPLIPALNKHDHLLTLLTQPRHLDAISRRVKLLLVDLDRASAASRRTDGAGTTSGSGQAAVDKGDRGMILSQAEYNQLQSLFGVLPRLDPFLPIMTPLLARLRSLSSLHAEASEIASTLRQVQTKDKKSSEEVEELKQIVNAIQSGLDGAVEGIKKNWEGLESRMKTLEGRLQAVEKGA